MMSSAQIIAPIWDYGWLCRDQIDFPEQTSDRALIDTYCKSACFHTCFLPTDKPETGLHGPFQASMIASDDFVEFEQHSLEAYLKDILYSGEWEIPASEDQFAAVLQLLSEPYANGARCYLLKRDETDKDLQHDWGFVFVVFREFIFIDDQRRTIMRYVIGYD